MTKPAPIVPTPEIPLEVLLQGFDIQTLMLITKNLQDYEYELKQRRKGKILYIPLVACNGLKVAVYEWAKIREITSRLRQLRNRPEEEQAPYKQLITLVTEAQYTLAEIFDDATEMCDGKEFFK
jgi:hypothetical protein